MRRIEIIALVAFAPALLILGFGSAMHLMSVANDMAVYGGYLLLVASLAMLGTLLLRYRRTALEFLRKNPRKPPLAILLVCAFCLTTTGCYKIVQPGHAGLLIKQTGTDRGVQDYPIQTGRVFYNPLNEDVMEWPTNVQRIIWSANTGEGHAANEEISFQSKEGLHFTADVNAAYQMVREKVPHFYVQFRTDDLDQFSHGFFRDAVRNAFNSSTAYTAEEINGARQSELIYTVQDAVKKKMEVYGVEVIQIGFAAPPRPPTQVKQSIESKIAAIQKSEQIEFEKRAAIAEGEKIKALADAYADANRATNASLTPQLIDWEKIKKWDGHNSQVVTSAGAGTLVNVK